ncbi:MAG TPA: hypothetical protein VIG53_00885 [Actinomycetota bacterium]
MKRPFWVALGLGAGATGAIIASRWTKKQAQRVAPATIARETKGGLMDLSKLVSESIQEGKQEMERREAELRRRHDVRDGPGSGADPAPAPGEPRPDRR